MKFCLRPHRRSIRIRLEKVNEKLASSYDRLERIQAQQEVKKLTPMQLLKLKEQEASVLAIIEVFRKDIDADGKALAMLPKNWFELFRKYVLVIVSTTLVLAGIWAGIHYPENTDVSMYFCLLGGAGLGINGIRTFLQSRKKDQAEEQKASRFNSRGKPAELAA